MTLTIGSLFSGIGGLELGLEWAGLGPVLWQCEIDPFCRAVLAKHWPDAVRYEDVRAIDLSVPRVDLICGGFPCQDISTAGRGEGLCGSRSGLWYTYLGIIRELRPRFVVVENVAALLSRGADTVLGGLASLGYDAEWHVVPASAVGAPHERERLFIVANANGDRLEALASEPVLRAQADSGRVGRLCSAIRGKGMRQREVSPEPCLCGDVDGVPVGMDRRRVIRRIKALGNAVVPQCAQVVGEVIQQMIAAEAP